MDNRELYHWGIQGMKWGRRRYQNEDGTLTPEGKARYAKQQMKARQKFAKKYQDFDGRLTDKGRKKIRKQRLKLGYAMADQMTDEELRNATNRLRAEKAYEDAFEDRYGMRGDFNRALKLYGKEGANKKMGFSKDQNGNSGRYTIGKGIEDGLADATRKYIANQGWSNPNWSSEGKKNNGGGNGNGSGGGTGNGGGFFYDRHGRLVAPNGTYVHTARDDPSWDSKHKDNVNRQKRRSFYSSTRNAAVDAKFTGKSLRKEARAASAGLDGYLNDIRRGKSGFNEKRVSREYNRVYGHAPTVAEMEVLKEYTRGKIK